MVFKYYLHDTYHNYKAFGFNRKVLQLENPFKEQLAEERAHKDLTATSLPYKELVRLFQVIDFDNMLKISNSLTSETNLSSLIKKLLTEISNQTNSDRIFLFLKRKISSLLKASMLITEMKRL